MENDADVNLCIGGPLNQTALHAAAVYGDLTIMDCLIQAGANVNVQDSFGATPLFCAFVVGKNDAAIQLMENGADVNICIGGPLIQTALYVAAVYGDLTIIYCLIQAGANVNMQDSFGAKPLILAVAKGKTEAAILLMENGADVNLCTSGDRSMSAFLYRSTER
jgi:ankyrin repeat protein